MQAVGLILILLGSAIALVGRLTEKPRVVETIKVVEREQVRKPSIGQFADRNAKGQMCIPDIAPDGAQTLFKWTAIESADGHVFYGTRYIHPKEIKEPFKQ